MHKAKEIEKILMELAVSGDGARIGAVAACTVYFGELARYGKREAESAEVRLLRHLEQARKDAKA